MSTTHIGGEKRSRTRGEKADRYWLVWMAAGFGAGSVITHVLV